MSVVVIPIKPVFAYRVLTGKKKFDLRKLVSNEVPVKTGDRVILYVTGSVKAFMGECTVGRVIVGSYNFIKKTLGELPGSGVNEEDFSYIRGAERALAMEMVKPIVYRKPVEMKEVLRIFPDYRPPLGIQKLDEHEPVVVLVFNKARNSTLQGER